MTIQFSPDFDRQFMVRLTARQRVRILDAIYLFEREPFHADFRNHSLHRPWAGYRSISVGGDVRLHYQALPGDVAYFVAVGTHEQLYGR